MVNLLLLHDRQTLPEHTVNLSTGNAESVNHLLWSRSLSETFRGATFCQQMRYLGEVIATVVSVTLGRLLTSWNMMRADSRGGKMAPDSHLWIYHLQTRQFGTLSCVTTKKTSLCWTAGASLQKPLKSEILSYLSLGWHLGFLVSQKHVSPEKKSCLILG